jgi:hypothetical protein
VGQACRRLLICFAYRLMCFEIIDGSHRIQSSSFGLCPSCNRYITALKHCVSEADSSSIFRPEARNLLDPTEQAILSHCVPLKHTSVGKFLRTSGTPRGREVWGLNLTPRNSEVLTKLGRIPYSLENTSITIRIQVSLVYKLSGTPDWGATAPRSPFSLPSVLN